MNDVQTELILQNRNLIYSISCRYPYEDQDDLFQVGAKGLWSAYLNFDDSRGVKFTTYAYPYILGEIRKYVRENKGIKISREITRLSLEIEKYNLLFYQQMERFPSVEELACHFRKTEQEIVQAIYSRNQIQSAEQPIVQDGKEMNLYDVVASPRQENMEELLDLRDALLALPQDEQELIHYRYYQDFSQTEIAKVLDMSQVQVSRKEHKVLKKLNHMLH